MSNIDKVAHRKQEVLEQIRKLAIVPVLRVPKREHVISAVEGLLEADLSIAELTMTIPGCIELIREIRATYGERLLLGAGTVLDVEACRLAIAAGAEFIVSPIFDPDVLAEAREHGILCIPGALTPTEVIRASRAGADLIKIFPSGSVGGPEYIRALKAPFPNVELIVTGGVNLDNAAVFIEAGATAVGVGEKLFSREALMNGDVKTIASNASRFLDALKSRRSAT